MATRLNDWLNAHQLALFFALSFAISWGIWLPELLAGRGVLAVPVSPYLHMIGGLGPMVAALIVTGVVAGRSGLSELGGRMVRWRVGLRWHLIAWFGPVALYVIGAVIVRIAWGTWPDPARFGQSEEYPQLPILVYWAATIFFYGWGEETGWRGFALPRLQGRHNALTASLILSVFWALWHLPLFWSTDGYATMGLAGAAGWYVSIVLGSILLTWLYNSARGSILIVAIFHGTTDIVFNSPAPGDLATVIGGLMMLWGILVLLRYKPATLARTDVQIVQPVGQHKR